MSFTDVAFAFFFPAVLVIHWLLPRRAWAQNGWLLLASWVFYASWSPRLLWVLLLSTAVDWGLGLILDGERFRPAQRRAALGLSIAFNVGLLCWFKYEGFFASSLDALLGRMGLGAPLPVLALVAPIGLSFYTFQKLSYVIDVYDTKIPACRSPLTFAAFVAFFPQIVAGPIVRGPELLPQWATARRFDIDQLARGASIFLLGFFKKAFVADILRDALVDPVFDHPAAFSTAGHWVGLVGYAVHLYCDFSGYSEMAIGAGRMLGLELPVNFNYPFLSKSVAELWRRWHITLNTWLFEYLYGPMTTGRGFMRGRLGLGFIVVFLVSGLWHGPRWTYVVWGLLHGLALWAHFRWDAFYRGLCRKDRRWVARRKTVGYALVAWAGTQAWFVLTLVPFRALTLGDAGRFLRGLVVPTSGLLLPLAPAPVGRTFIFAVAALFLLVYHLLELPRGQAIRARLLALPAPVRGVVYGLVIALVYLFMPTGGSTFVYAQF